MCGRYALHSLIEDIQKHFSLFDDIRFRPGFNMAPSLNLPVVREQQGRRELALCRWGLVPHWMRADKGHHPINARAETITEKPFFRDAFRRRRCLVPINGFYEWRRGAKRKQPYYFKLPGTELFALAGIWDRRNTPGGPEDTFAIITTGANDIMRPVHDRMPVVLEKSDYNRWIESGDPDLLQPFPGDMECFPVSTEVNSPAHDGPSLIEPAHGDRSRRSDP
jgi:putative SOS response-associated peptidase YedK